MVAVFEQSLYTVDTAERGTSKIEVRTFQGTVKQLLPFSDIEGMPTYMAVCTHYLVVATGHGYIKLFDLGRRYVVEVAKPK